MKESEKRIRRQLEQLRRSLVKKEVKPDLFGRKPASPAEIRKVITENEKTRIFTTKGE